MLLRVLRDDPAPAAWNMAVDEALLTLAATPTLRLYGWSPHAVSLGYFQRLADFTDLPSGTPMVRRLTGGGAIHHGDEITFSLALDTHLLPRDVHDSYRLVHDAAIAALKRHGIASSCLAAGELPAARPSERWCFALPGRGDVVTPTGKLLGSAQRRIVRPRPRVLHHGSLVVRRPGLTPFVASIADTCANADDRLEHAVREALVEQIAAALGTVPTAGSLTAPERALAERLATARYGDAAFLHAR